MGGNMKRILALAAAAFLCAPVAAAQGGQQPAPAGSLRLLPAKPSEAPPQPAAAAAPEASAPAPEAAPEPSPPPAPASVQAAAIAAPVATGWTGPVTMSPDAVVDLVSRVCRPAVTGDGGDVQALAVSLGLGGALPPPAEMARALPNSAMVWRVPSTDGELYLVTHGEARNCGAAVLRPMPEAGFDKVSSLLQTPGHGFTPDASQILPGDVRWSRLRSPKGEFVDVMEYPPSGEETPGVLRADYLPQ